MDQSYNWYMALTKPAWAPPSWIFGPVWTVLYGIIIVSYAAVFYGVYNDKVPRFVIVPFVLNIIFNLAFTPLQFGLKNNYLAAIDIVLVLITLIWGLWAIWPYMRWVSYVNIPYVVWVTFATVLQLTITFLNMR